MKKRLITILIFLIVINAGSAFALTQADLDAITPQQLRQFITTYFDTPYQVFGLSEDAQRYEINQSFRILMKWAHTENDALLVKAAKVAYKILTKKYSSKNERNAEAHRNAEAYKYGFQAYKPPYLTQTDLDLITAKELAQYIRLNFETPYDVLGITPSMSPERRRKQFEAQLKWAYKRNDAYLVRATIAAYELILQPHTQEWCVYAHILNGFYSTTFRLPQPGRAALAVTEENIAMMIRSGFNTPFEVLGVDESAPRSMIDRAFQEQRQKHRVDDVMQEVLYRAHKLATDELRTTDRAIWEARALENHFYSRSYSHYAQPAQVAHIAQFYAGMISSEFVSALLPPFDSEALLRVGDALGQSVTHKGFLAFSWGAMVGTNIAASTAEAIRTKLIWSAEDTKKLSKRPFAKRMSFITDKFHGLSQRIQQHWTQHASLKIANLIGLSIGSLTSDVYHMFWHNPTYDAYKLAEEGSKDKEYLLNELKHEFSEKAWVSVPGLSSSVVALAQGEKLMFYYLKSVANDFGANVQRYYVHHAEAVTDRVGVRLASRFERQMISKGFTFRIANYVFEKGGRIIKVWKTPGSLSMGMGVLHTVAFLQLAGFFEKAYGKFLIPWRRKKQLNTAKEKYFEMKESFLDPNKLTNEISEDDLEDLEFYSTSLSVAFARYSNAYRHEEEVAAKAHGAMKEQFLIENSKNMLWLSWIAQNMDPEAQAFAANVGGWHAPLGSALFEFQKIFYVHRFFFPSRFDEYGTSFVDGEKMFQRFKEAGKFEKYYGDQAVPKMAEAMLAKIMTTDDRYTGHPVKLFQEEQSELQAKKLEEMDISYAKKMKDIIRETYATDSKLFEVSTLGMNFFFKEFRNAVSNSYIAKIYNDYIDDEEAQEKVDPILFERLDTVAVLLSFLDGFEVNIYNPQTVAEQIQELLDKFENFYVKAMELCQFHNIDTDHNHRQIKFIKTIFEKLYEMIDYYFKLLIVKQTYDRFIQDEIEEISPLLINKYY